MPKTILLALLALVALSLSTSLKAQTTETEYNYMTKGYALDLADGRDIKAGYHIEAGPEGLLYGRVIKIEYLIRSNGTTAGIILTHTHGENKFYSCIPGEGTAPELVETAFKQYIALYIDALPEDNKSTGAELAFMWGMMAKTVGHLKLK